MFGLCVSQRRVALGGVHAQGGRHRRVGACQSQGSTFALLGRAHPARRHGLLWCALSPLFLPLITLIAPHVAGTHVYDRADLALHPRPAGQEARAPVQSARCTRLPLHPTRQHARARHAAHPVAPEPARALPALRGASRAGTEGRSERRREEACACADIA